MIIVNGYSNADEQLEAICKNKIPEYESQCLYCELAAGCPNNRCNSNEAKSSTSTYAMKEFDSCYIPANTALVECESKKVTDGIGEKYKIDPDCFLDENNLYCDFDEINTDGWEPVQPVFISAQTGQGKNYFIEHTLIPYVRKINVENKSDFKILIISNRLALKKQIENHLAGRGDNDNSDRIYSYNDTADVITYQGLLRQKITLEQRQKQKGRQYLYVICDEAHFFTSDAMFNPHTSRILSSIISVFNNSIRIYMSATPYECLSYIVNEESKKFNNSNDILWNNMIAFYHFNRDYSYLNVTMYSKIEELYNEIINSKKQTKRWLIFIDNKSKCSTVKDSIENKIYGDKEKKPDDENPVVLVDTDHKGDEKYISLIKKEALSDDTIVLISTSVLDNGINLNNIDNIVVSDADIVKCLQMVGRARSKNTEKRLYIQRFDKKYIKDRICEYEACRTAYHEFDLAYNQNSYVKDQKNSYEYKFLSKYYDGFDREWKIAKHLFGRYLDKPNALYPNEIAKELVDNRVEMYRLILEEMEQEELQAKSGSNVHIGQGYLEYQLSWFRKEYCEDDDLTFMDKDKAKKQLISFLKSCIDDNTIFKKYNDTAANDKNAVNLEPDNQMYFRKTFTKLYDSAFGRKDNNKGRIYDITKINKLLSVSNLPYEVINKSKLGWIIVKKNHDSENNDVKK